MRIRTTLALSAALALVAAPAFAQQEPVWRATGFSQPESASYDAATGTIFVSNIASPDFSPNMMGYVSQLAPDGTVINAHFVDGLVTPAGTDVRDGTLWVVTGAGLAEIDIATAMVRTVHARPEGALFLNDVFAAPDGRVYVTDVFGAAVYVLRDGALTLLVQDARLTGANGITVIGNTAYVGTIANVTPETGFNAPMPSNIKTINLETLEIGDFGSAAPIGQLDGVEPMGDGFIVTDNGGGRVVRVGPDGTVSELFMPGAGAADLDYVAATGLVIVPMLYTGEVVAYTLPQ